VTLFPRCTFEILVPGAVLRAGERNRGTLLLVVPERIERVQQLELVFESLAIAGYGSGNRFVVRRSMFIQPLALPLEGALGPGRHEFAFELDLPPWLPPAYRGRDCSIQHRVDLRLDVDWALDPKETIWPDVRVPAGPQALARPCTTRSPVGFDDDVAVDVTLCSSVIARGAPLEGSVALRTGHDADFRAVVLTLSHSARVAMGRGDTRDVPLLEVRIPADLLRGGRAVPFRFDHTSGLPLSLSTGFLDFASALRVGLDRSWYQPTRHFWLPLDVLPEGTPIVAGGAAPVALGGERLALIGRAIAERTGLRAGTPPRLAYGREGIVDLYIEDASRGSEVGALEVHVFPDLGLGTQLRLRGWFEGAGVAPDFVAQRWAIHVSDETHISEETLRAFFARVLVATESAVDLQLSDHRLALRWRLAADTGAAWVSVAEAGRARARAITEAIGALPFPDGIAREAWTTAAAIESAVLLPHLPALHGVTRSARTVGSDVRTLTCSLVTVRERGETRTRLDASFDAPLPPEAARALAGGAEDELLRALRGTFASLEAATPEHVIGIAEGAHADPRPLLAALDTLLEWALRARGERRAVGAYR
jgi:hypothetical protein